MTSFEKTSITLCGIEEMTTAYKTSIIILVFGIKEKQLRCEKHFYCLFIISRGNDHFMNPFYKGLITCMCV